MEFPICIKIPFFPFFLTYPPDFCSYGKLLILTNRFQTGIWGFRSLQMSQSFPMSFLESKLVKELELAIESELVNESELANESELVNELELV